MIVDILRAFVEAVVSREMLRGYRNDPRPTDLRVCHDGSLALLYEVP